MQIVTNYSKNNIQFNGLANIFARQHARTSQKQVIANILRKKDSDIFQMTKYISNTRLGFFSLLTNIYNKNNFYKPAEAQEDVNTVIQIYKNVKKPKKAHYSLVSSFHGSFQTLNDIFQAINNKQKRANFAYLINKQVINNNTNVYENLIPELLESKNSEKYVNNYNKYLSYLILNREDKNVVKNLDKMVSNKTYNRKYYDDILKKNQIINSFPFKNNQIFNAEMYYENYTKQRSDIISKLYDKTSLANIIQDDNFSRCIKEIYNSTTSKNYNLRTKLINLQSTTDLNIEELNKLFNIIDEDKFAKKFIKKFIDKKYVLHNIQKINNVLENVQPLKLNIFSDNAFRIMNMTSGSECIDTLKKELENPFYETSKAKSYRLECEKYGYRKKQGSISKLIKQIKNCFNILQYNLIEHSQNNTIKEHAIVTNPMVEIKPLNSTEVIQNLDKQVPAMADSVSQKDIIPKPVAITLTNESKTEQINNEIKISKKIKKEELKANIFEILNIKLGKSTFAKQKEAYGKNATKIKLSLLPEIFTSVADTRKADRAVGKYKINSSNKDVLDLYLLINGSNKKYINYLLKKRNVDGTRMFEVKDIISMIKKAESKIAENKKSNPQYRARDARQYYNHLYESKIQQYGKVTRARKNKVDTKA